MQKHQFLLVPISPEKEYAKCQFQLASSNTLAIRCLTPPGASPLAPVKRSPSLGSWEMLDLDEERGWCWTRFQQQTGIVKAGHNIDRTS